MRTKTTCVMAVTNKTVAHPHQGGGEEIPSLMGAVRIHN
jgi:hypothetical protein